MITSKLNVKNNPQAVVLVIHMSTTTANDMIDPNLKLENGDCNNADDVYYYKINTDGR